MKQLPALFALVSLFAAGCAASSDAPDEASDETSSALAKEPVPVRPVRPRPPIIHALQPDLVAVTYAGDVGQYPSDYCGYLGNGKLRVRVKNQGLVAAGSSVTRIQGGRGSVDVPTKALAAGEIVDLDIDLSSIGAFGPDLGYTIILDVANQVRESNEDDTSYATCIG